MSVPGSSPLNYPINTQSAIQRISRNRAPNSTDYKNVREGDEWLDKSSMDWWKLSDVSGSTAIWSLIGGTPGAVQTLTATSGGAIGPDSSHNINILSSGSITTTGTPGTNTITIGNSGNLATTYTTDSGTATPSSNNLNINSTASGFLNTSGATDTISLNINNFVDASVNNWTPTIIGTSAPGAGTYTTQHGVYMRLGKLIIATFDLVWSAHTGTGNMKVAGFPVEFALSSSHYPGIVIYENLTLPGSTIQIVLDGDNAATTASVSALLDASSISQVVIDTAASLSGTIIYFSDA